MQRTSRLVTGLVIAGVLGLFDTGSLLQPTSGPAPVAVNLLDGVLGLLTLGGIVLVARGRRSGGARLVITSRVLSAVSSLPAFVAGVPASVIAIASAGIALTAIAVCLLLPNATSPQPSVA